LAMWDPIYPAPPTTRMFFTAYTPFGASGQRVVVSFY
jgi:hypothetical protein